MSFALEYPLAGKGYVTLPGETWTNVYLAK